MSRTVCATESLGRVHQKLKLQVQHLHNIIYVSVRAPRKPFVKCAWRLQAIII